MVLRLFRRDPRPALIETLYQRIAAASRHPVLYLRLGVPDTVEGRFEALALHAALVLRRLRELPPPADEVAQEVVDRLFRHLEEALRELGVGDLAVPKRMKTLAGAFYGRLQAYDAGLAGAEADALAIMLGRNVAGTSEPAHALAEHVRASAAALSGLDLDTLLTAGPRFAMPDGADEEARP